MACPCKNKQSQAKLPAIVGDPRVPLGLAADVPLPMLFENIYKGYDVLVLAYSNAPFDARGRNILPVPGRNAKVSPELRQAIMDRFPNMFVELRQMAEATVV